MDRSSRVLIAFLVLRRHAPTWPVTCAVFIAQLGAWFIGWHGALIAGCSLLLLLILTRRCSTFLVGMIVGFLSVVCGTTPPSDHVPVSADMLTLVQVIGEPRRIQVGGVSFVGASLLDTSPFTRYSFSAVDLPWRNAHSLENGDVAWVRASCAPIPLSWNPFSFDSRSQRDNIRAKCKARYVSEVVDRTPSILDVPRQELLRRTRAAVGDSQGLSIFLAMSLGYRDLLSAQAEREFQMAGLSHLLVVSGYQVTLVFSMVFFIVARVLRLISRFSEPRRLATFPAILFAVGYVLLCGAESSTVRALIAAACVAVQVLDEHALRFSQRCITAFLILMLVSPWCFFDLGVQLTFAALAGIGLGSYLSSTRRGVKALWSVSLCVWLLTSIVGLIWTGRLSLAAIVFNLILATPWSVVDCTFGLLAVAVCVSGVDSNGYLLRGVVWLNQKALDMVSWGAAVPYAAVKVETFSSRSTVVAGLLGVLLLLVCQTWRRSVVSWQISRKLKRKGERIATWSR